MATFIQTAICSSCGPSLYPQSVPPAHYNLFELPSRVWNSGQGLRAQCHLSVFQTSTVWILWPDQARLLLTFPPSNYRESMRRVLLPAMVAHLLLTIVWNEIQDKLLKHFCEFWQVFPSSCSRKGKGLKSALKNLLSLVEALQDPIHKKLLVQTIR